MPDKISVLNPRMQQIRPQRVKLEFVIILPQGMSFERFYSEQELKDRLEKLLNE